MISMRKLTAIRKNALKPSPAIFKAEIDVLKSHILELTQELIDSHLMEEKDARTQGVDCTGQQQVDNLPDLS